MSAREPGGDLDTADDPAPSPAPSVPAGGELIAYAILIVVGGYMVVSSFEFGLHTGDAWIGPGTMPLVIGALLVGIAAPLLLVGLRRRSLSGASTESPQRNGDDVDIFGRTKQYRVRQLWTVLVALAVTIGLVPLLGFLLAFGLLALFVSTVVEKRRMVAALLVTVVSVASAQLIFVEFLGVPLPQGLFGIGGL